VMLFAPALDAERVKHAVAAWSAVFVTLAVAFIVNHSVLPLIDHRYRAVFYPGDRLAAALTDRFHAATGRKLRYVIGSMWDGGNVAHYSPDQPHVLIDGMPRRAPWIDLADLPAQGAVVVWTIGDNEVLPPRFAYAAQGAEIGAPFVLPMRRGFGAVHVGWAILMPQAGEGAPGPQDRQMPPPPAH
jgi:hypothetical protein